MRQPDGRLAVFSTVTDTFIMTDATVSEVVDFFAEEAAEQMRLQVGAVAEAVAAGRDPYPRNLAMTWAEAVESDRMHGGEFSERTT
jgi:hypothetical protein